MIFPMYWNYIYFSLMVVTFQKKKKHAKTNNLTLTFKSPKFLITITDTKWWNYVWEFGTEDLLQTVHELFKNRDPNHSVLQDVFCTVIWLIGCFHLSSLSPPSPYFLKMFVVLVG